MPQRRQLHAKENGAVRKVRDSPITASTFSALPQGVCFCAAASIACCAGLIILDSAGSQSFGRRRPCPCRLNPWQPSSVFVLTRIPAALRSSIDQPLVIMGRLLCASCCSWHLFRSVCIISNSEPASYEKYRRGDPKNWSSIILQISS